MILLFQQVPPSEDSDHYRYSSRALVLFAAQRIGGHTVIWVKALMVAEMPAAWTFIVMTVFDAVQAVERAPQNPVTSGLVWWGTTARRGRHRDRSGGG